LTTLDLYLSEDRLCLFDVGARGGLHERWQPYGRFLDVVGFEADAEECARLASEGRFLPYALGRETRSGVPFYVARWPVASSVYPPNPAVLDRFLYASALLRVDEERTVDTVALDEVCDQAETWPDCLKLDVEGAELDVLLGGPRAVRHALVLEVEVEFLPIRIGQPLFADVDEHLRAVGWELVGLRRTHWRHKGGLDGPTGGQLVQADALYINMAAVADLSQTRALKLLVALTAYRQLDLVLDLLRGRFAALLPADEVEQLLVPTRGVDVRVTEDPNFV